MRERGRGEELGLGGPSGREVRFEKFPIGEKLDRPECLEEGELRRTEEVDHARGERGVLEMTRRAGTLVIERFLGMQERDAESDRQEKGQKKKVQQRPVFPDHFPEGLLLQ
jgi:hypothetical protein